MDRPDCGENVVDFRRNPSILLIAALIGGLALLRTIAIGSCVSVQGLVVGQLADGKVMVKVDEQTFVGYPVMPARKS